jgi:outer membrane usher protein
LLRGPGNQFYAPLDSLRGWRLKPPPWPAFTRQGVTYYRLNDIAGAGLELIEATQTLTIIVPPQLFETSRLAYAPVELDDRVVSGSGAFVNYDASVQLAQGVVSGGAAIESGIFTAKGVGVSGFVGRFGGGTAEFVRLESNWTVDDPGRMRSLRIGDSVSRAGTGGVPVRFAGIQLARNFGVQPGFVTLPLPSVSGSAAVPSVVDIYVNGALRGSRDVKPGPFELTDVPIITGNGDVQLVVRDLLGRERVYSQSYYAAPTLLRRGLHDFSYEAGFLRASFGRESNDYGALMMSATHRYGFSNRFTGELHVEASKDVQAGRLGGNLVVPDVGHIGASLAASRSGLGQGAQAAISFDRRSSAVSLGFSAEFTTSGYSALGWSADRRPPASTIQAFAGIPLGFGSVSLSYLRRDSRDDGDSEFVGASSSIRLGRIGSLNLAARKDLNTARGISAELSLTMSMGPLTTSSTAISLEDGKRTYRSQFQKSLPVGEGVGYQFGAARGAADRLDGRIKVQTSFGTHDAQLTWTDGKTGVRLSTVGGLGMVGGQAFASRQLTQSFAMVKVGDYPNVRIYADNQLIGRTDRSGRAIVPRLRPFDRNAVRVELADLPWDAQIGDGEQIIRPFNRHGVQVLFEARPARAAMIRIRLEDGSPLPAGSIVTLGQGPDEFITAPGGDVYLTGLGKENSAIASWSGGKCSLSFDYAETGEPQPDLGEFACRRAAQ